MGKTLAIILALAASASAQNYALRWHPTGGSDPTNCIAEWLNIGTRTSQAGYFVTNSIGLRWFLAHSETNFITWDSNRVWQVEQPIRLLLTEYETKKAFIDGITNMATVNNTQIGTNILRLRQIEHELERRGRTVK